MKRNCYIAAALFAMLAALWFGSSALQKRAVVEAAAAQAPRFEVDPMWPKPLPNHWVIGSVIGVAADASDHIWIIHRQGSLEPKEMSAASKPPGAECCSPAPPVLEFNEAGDLIGHWGGPGQGYDWPSSNHGITVDYKGNVWIGGNGRGAPPPAPAPVTTTGGNGEQAAEGRGQQPPAAGGQQAPYHDNMILKFTQEDRK